MGYTVVRDFSDSKDGRRVYRVGDVYPHPTALVPDEERLKELLGTGNKQGVPLIRKDASLATGGTLDTQTAQHTSKETEAKRSPRRGQKSHARTGT